MKDLFFFDSMLTPKIITFVYWLMLLAAVASGVTSMFTPYSGGFIIGLVILIAGVIAARIWCELLIVLFKIHDNLKKIADRNETSEL